MIDLHSHILRRSERLGDRRLARYLTVEAPEAIVAGADLPERSLCGRRRRRFIVF
jgi:hypothetical protein